MTEQYSRRASIFGCEEFSIYSNGGVVQVGSVTSYFTRRCLPMLGVGVVNGVDFVGDERCYAAPCSDTSKVAFHP